jgi:hypothetical protein
MTITPIPLHLLRKKMDFIPHAVLSVPISYLAKLMDTQTERGEDDLDQYIGLGAQSEEFGPFAIMHYRGYPKDTSTIYLPREFPDDVEKVTQAVHWIVRQLNLKPQVVSWERKDNPDL